MQSSDPSVTIGTKFSHLRESSSGCDICRLGQPAGSAHPGLQSPPAAVSPPLQQHVTELEVGKRQELGGKGGTRRERRK